MIARTGGDATGIAMISGLNIGIQDITIIIRDLTAISVGIVIMIAMEKDGNVSTTAGNEVRRRGWFMIKRIPAQGTRNPEGDPWTGKTPGTTKSARRKVSKPC
jgi:hypothetical protein